MPVADSPPPPLVDVKAPPTKAAENAFTRYFRCPEELARFEVSGELFEEEGYFTFSGAICYGRRAGFRPSRFLTSRLHEAFGTVSSPDGSVRLPFDLSAVVENFQQERYRRRSRGAARKKAVAAARRLYYYLRPGLPVAVRKHFQRFRLSGWRGITFPRWPLDDSVEVLMEGAMRLLLEASGRTRIPFIWFWPNGAQSGVIMTHDVEGPAGRDFCDQLMDLDDAFAIKSAFQVVPEMESERLGELTERFRRRGFEVNLHDLNHDGYLFQDREEFLRRAARINGYARRTGCRGFRSGVMYRRQEWFGALDVEYDMSVPNVAHLDPQRGGCCTVMPYLIGDILELPLTTVQDYSLFHILGDYSIAVWKRQLEQIAARNGLVSFITHPDYLIETRAREVYVELLTHLQQVRTSNQLWIALPGDVEQWWRNRSRMRLVEQGGCLSIEGPDSARARVAYASLEADRIVYTIDGISA